MKTSSTRPATRLTPGHTLFARACLLVLVLGLALATTGCDAIAGLLGGGTITITDGMGRTVEVPRRIQRIVSLAPANTEILYAVGAGAKVVGVDDFSNYPPEAATVAKIGGYLDINVEAVIALKPDVVLASTIHQGPVEQLEQLGIKCVVVEPRNIGEVYGALELVGRLVGQEAKAKSVVTAMQSQIAAVTATLAVIPAEERKLVFYEVWGDPLMSAGPNTYTHEIIELAGGRNLAADAVTDYPILGYEIVVARDPAVIVYPTFPGSAELTAAVLATRPGWASIKAVREEQVFGIDADIMARGGPRLAEAVAAMARLIYPGLFE